MIEHSMAFHVLTAMIIGFIIGLQRELNNLYKNKKDLAGARTFSLISLLGYLSSFLSFDISLGLIILIIVGYYLNSKDDEQHRGITTEVSLIITFVLGLLIAQNQVLAIFISVLVVFMLNIKDKLVKIEEKINKEEINATVIFLLITVTVLPILPNHTVDEWNLINPYKLWLFVILVSSISFAGYILSKIYGNRGIYITGFLGGLASSTATTIIFSKRSRDNSFLSKETAVGIGLANSMMFFRVYILTLIFNVTLAKYVLFPFVLASLSGFIYLYFLSRGAQKVTQKVEFTNPFDVFESIKFGLLFGAVFIGIKVGHQYLGDAGLYIVAIISGVSDVDAITISLSEMKNISIPVVALGIIIATLANQSSKLIYSFFVGSRENFKYFAIFNLITISTLLGSYFILKGIL
jgi:uncharacterized membrane protein (DUF4010 family)